MVSRGIIVSRSIIKDFTATSLSKDDNVKIDKFKKMAKSSESYKPSREQEEIVYKYQVRIPLIHGMSGDSSSVPDGQLPEATFCPLPGSQETALEIGDIVYVAVVDFRFDDIVILGHVPNSQRISSDGVSLKRVQYLRMDKEAPLYANNVHIGEGKEEITTKNLQALQGFEYKLNEYVWPLENGGTGVSISDKYQKGDRDIEEAKKKFLDSFGIYKNVVLSSTEFEKLQNQNTFESGTIYYIYQDEEE